MTATAEMLFNMQKFQILSLFTSEVATRKVSPAYAYAWAEDLYPIGQHSAPWHEPYQDCFKIGPEQLTELSEFLDDLWTKGETISFYDLEIHYGVRGSVHDGPEWDRMSLVHACRYFHLLDWFDEAFWKGLVGHTDCPSESHSVVREYKTSGAQPALKLRWVGEEVQREDIAQEFKTVLQEKIGVNASLSLGAFDPK